MEQFLLNNGQKMPVLGFGLFGMPDYDQAASVTVQALHNGYRHLDTATRYQNEAAIGQGIRDSGVPREDIFLTTKVWNDMQREGKVRESLEDSLKAFGTDYVDMFMIHWPVPGHFTNSWKIMESIYREGLAKSIGVCNFRPVDLEQLAAVSDIVPVVNQIEIQPYFQQNETVKYCTDRHIQMMAWGTLTSGKSNLLEDPVLVNLAKKHGKTPAQIVIRWNYQRNIVCLVKSATPSRQKQNLDIFDFVLDENDMKQIAALDCGQRMGRDPADSDF